MDDRHFSYITKWKNKIKIKILERDYNCGAYSSNSV
jgi:hypothetical protein